MTRTRVTEPWMPDPRIKSAVARLGLTGRERRVVECLADGQTTRQVAKTMGIGDSTVRTHIRKIFIRLDVNTRVELMSLVLSNVLEDVDSVGPPETDAAVVELTNDRRPGRGRQAASVGGG